VKDKEIYTSPPTKTRSEVQPWQVLVFVLLVFGILVGVMAIFPKKGIRLTQETTLRFPTLAEFLAEDTDQVDMKAILAEIDALGKVDSISETIPMIGEEVSPVIANNEGKKIQYPEGDRSVLFPAFEALSTASSGTGPVRVIHFGDSQIEGDRMTNLIRNEFQKKFGGNGPGLQPGIPAIPSFSVRQEHSENFKRYPGYGKKDPAVKHRRYGVTASFARYGDYVVDSLLDSLPNSVGWLKILPSRNGYGKVKTYSTVTLFYGHNRRPFKLQMFADEALISEDSIPVNSSLQTRTWKFEKTPQSLQIFFQGPDSPEIYGVSLEGNSGVQVDNVGLRGQSGTLFGGLHQGTFKGMTNALDVKLLLLQFGGNTIPYMKSEKSAQNYGQSFKNQINYLKRCMPDASVIVIGPSDMATKVEGKMQTYPLLPAVRDALKEGAFEAGAAYFDIYEVMGGMNSMIGWVEHKPALAGKDYVHFTPAGAKKVARTFVASFLEDYAAYQKGAVQ